MKFLAVSAILASSVEGKLRPQNSPRVQSTQITSEG